MKTWFSENLKTNCAYFPETMKLAIVNNVATAEKTTIFEEIGQPFEVKLEPYQMKWFEIECRNPTFRDTADK